MKVVVASKKNEKKSPMLSMMLINRFEGNCGTFGEEKKNSLLSMTMV
jgi:hypothetical protein